jgi:hypothetical protein
VIVSPDPDADHEVVVKADKPGVGIIIGSARFPIEDPLELFCLHRGAFLDHRPEEYL